MFSTLTRRTLSASTPAASATPAAQITAIRYPYYVARQAISGRLPIYNEFRAGTKATTLIRNVDGNAGALRDDLLATLFRTMKPKPKVVVRFGKHVEVQGVWRNQIAEWLLSRGF